MSAVVVTKALNGERWELPADLDNRDLIIGFALGRGYTIESEEGVVPPIIGTTKAAPSGAVVEVRKGGKMGFKEILKAAEAGQVDQTALMTGVQKRANRQFPDAASEAIAFRMFCDARPDVLRLLKSAPAAVAKAQPSTSFGIIAEQALQECLKRGLPGLPANSPYAAYFAKSAVGDGTGSRDAVDPNYESEQDKTINAVADSLVRAGKFTSREIARRFMANSPSYSSLFGRGSGAARYREAIAGMQRDHLP